MRHSQHARPVYPGWLRTMRWMLPCSSNVLPFVVVPFVVCFLITHSAVISLGVATACAVFVFVNAANYMFRFFLDCYDTPIKFTSQFDRRRLKDTVLFVDQAAWKADGAGTKATPGPLETNIHAPRVVYYVSKEDECPWRLMHPHVVMVGTLEEALFRHATGPHRTAEVLFSETLKIQCLSKRMFAKIVCNGNVRGYKLVNDVYVCKECEE